MQPFEGIKNLFGSEAFEKIKKSHVCIIGLGGVGSWSAEALVRSGVGKITLVDMDDLCISNINRQIHALNTTVGQTKVDALADRLKLINSECEVEKIFDFYTEKTSDEILNQDYDFIIDAIDSVPTKCHLIYECQERNIPLVVTGACGGKMNPAELKVADLNKTFNDRLLFQVKKRLRQKFDFPRGMEPWNITCVFSSEKATNNYDPFCEDRKMSNCQNGLGAASFLTGSVGFFSAQIAISSLIGNDRPSISNS